MPVSVESFTNTGYGKRIVLLLEYDGSAFYGCQYQSHPADPERVIPKRVLPTVQQAVQDGLTALNIPFASFVFSGRTDKGVHARGQVAHFNIPENGLQNIPDLTLALNAVLPASVRIRGWAEIPPHTSFHCLLDARYRWYRYSLWNEPLASLWAPRDSLHIRDPLDVTAMRQAAQKLLGEHDFTTFKCPDTDVPGETCYIYHAGVTCEDSLIHFDIVANRFVYRMVRALTGLLTEVGAGRQPAEIMTRALAWREWQSLQEVSAIAKPDGLSLMAIDYSFHPFENDKYVQMLRMLINRRNTELTENEDLRCKAP